VADDDLELRIAWEQHLGWSRPSQTWFESVVSRYRLPGRHYHGVRHVRWVVRHVTDLAPATDDLGAVIAAAFFHDVIYDPTRNDNEMASAQLADRALTELSWESDRRRHVTELVLATIDHDVDSDGCSPDSQVLLAADLAVLAGEPAKYSDYVRGVRGEYFHVDDEAWRTGRSAVLRGLLGRRHLFAEALDLDEWEQRARANIAAELAMLER
jgi:predicted metal-dependent HD superfamily phosphohydrolase